MHVNVFLTRNRTSCVNSEFSVSRYGHHVEGAGSVFQMNTVITTNLVGWTVLLT